MLATGVRIATTLPMFLCGIGDEAGNSLESQIGATLKLGWRHLEMRNVQVAGFPKFNFHDLPEAAFETAAGALDRAGIQVACFGSTIMNWSKRYTDPFEITLAEVERAIPRMQRVGSKYIRIMSFKPGDHEAKIPNEVIERVRVVTDRFLSCGIQPVHENCMNYGGMSWQHGVQLLDAVPRLKWVFDTANPVFNFDRSRPQPWERQDPWEFWTHICEHVAHIHVKDARWNPSKNDADYTWPGEGDAAVRAILADAVSRGFDGGVSIEPHMVAVFHDANSQAHDEVLAANFVEYGQRLGRILSDAGTRLAAS